MEISDLFEEAKLTEQEGNYKKSFELYSKLVELDNKHWQAWLGKGISVGMLTTISEEHYEDAHECFLNHALIQERTFTDKEMFLAINPDLLNGVIDGYLKIADHIDSLLDPFLSEYRNWGNDKINLCLTLQLKGLKAIDNAYYFSDGLGVKDDSFLKMLFRRIVSCTKLALSRVDNSYSVLYGINGQSFTGPMRGMIFNCLGYSGLLNDKWFIIAVNN